MEKVFLFPSYKQLQPYDKRISKRIRSFIRYYTYRLWCLSECKEFENYLNNHFIWISLFSENFYRCNALLDKYCDKRFGKKERLEAITTNLSLAENKFGLSLSQHLLNEQHLLLGKLTDNLSLYLNINKIDPFEGFFSLSIKNKNNDSIYDASFTFIKSSSILVASLQGSNRENAQVLIKQATKELHGIRPRFMLVYVFKMISHILNCDLLGIKHKYQAKYRWNDHAKLLFNYDEFWKENKASLTKEKYWNIPLNIEFKPLEEIPSKKRSMYRQRYEMLERLNQELGIFFKDKFHD